MTTTIRATLLGSSLLLAGLFAGCGETESTTSALQRTRASAPCPGTLQTAVRITNSVQTPYGVGNPYSAGTCPISIAGLDSSGQPLSPNLALYPGESSSWFYPPSGSTSIVFACFDNCSGTAYLDYDTPSS